MGAMPWTETGPWRADPRDALRDVQARVAMGYDLDALIRSFIDSTEQTIACVAPERDQASAARPCEPYLGMSPATSNPSPASRGRWWKASTKVGCRRCPHQYCPAPGGIGRRIKHFIEKAMLYQCPGAGCCQPRRRMARSVKHPPLESRIHPGSVGIGFCDCFLRARLAFSSVRSRCLLSSTGNCCS
jgi:hypothetical protein